MERTSTSCACLAGNSLLCGGGDMKETKQELRDKITSLQKAYENNLNTLQATEYDRNSVYEANKYLEEHLSVYAAAFWLTLVYGLGLTIWMAL